MMERRKREKERPWKRNYRARRKAKQTTAITVSDDSNASASGTEHTDTDESSDDPDGAQVSIVSSFIRAVGTHQ